MISRTEQTSGLLSIDIALICGSRPKLLEQTLHSFSKNIFRFFCINRVIANVDLFGGSTEDQQNCVDLIRFFFPDSIVMKPRLPSFGTAVRNTWLSTNAKVVLHLEDDWLSLSSVKPDVIYSILNEQTRVIALSNKELPRSNVEVCPNANLVSKVLKKRFLGITYRKLKINGHGTAPGFYEGDFLRTYAKLIKPDLDPEKQIHPDINKELFEYVQSYRRVSLKDESGNYLIRDIGRDWRNTYGLKKFVIHGKSYWQYDSSREMRN